MRLAALVLIASLTMVAFAATAQAQTPEAVTITPFDGYSSACPASGSTERLEPGGRCDLKVEGLAVEDVTKITIEGVADDGTATAIACDDQISSRGWAFRCNGYAFLNWNRYFKAWEVWIYQDKLKESTTYTKIRVSVDSVAWEGTESTSAATPTGTRAISHNQGQPPVEVTNAVEAEAWNQFECTHDSNNDGRCTASDQGFRWTGTWGSDSAEPPEVPDSIVTACANNAVFFTNSDGSKEACP